MEMLWKPFFQHQSNAKKILSLFIILCRQFILATSCVVEVIVEPSITKQFSSVH